MEVCCSVLCKYVSIWEQRTCLWVGPQGQRWRKKEKKRGWRKMGQTAVIQALNSLLCSPAPSFSSSSSSLLSLRGSEGGHPLLQALNQPAGDLARPGYSARSLCLSACYTAIPLPSLCSWCQVTPPGAQRCCSNQMPFFLPAPCQNFTGRQLCFTSAYGIKRRLWQGPWHNTAQVNLYVGDLFPLKMQWWRAAGKSHPLWRGGLG